MRKIPRQAAIAIAAVVVAAVALGGSAFAGGRFDAQNAAKVDGFRAVGSGSSLSTAAGKLVATRSNGRGAGTFAPKFLGSVVRGRGAVQSFAVRLADGATHTLFTVPGVVTISLTCNASATHYAIGYADEHTSGWIGDTEIGSSLNGGGVGMQPGGGGTTGADGVAVFVRLTIQAGFGPAAHVATALIDLHQPNSHSCQAAGQVIRS